ncbi:MAG: hypothetical protein BZY79_03470 [SAR202 cluster bacterium Casp-Chloro-G4]|nr:hypothetical protein [Chloroflexota bacterium]MDA1227823.1 hypothetical protein [Chloroflexota bacterium]PKB61435.1 MAG: hypothetical protein BZY79_03470 [SAR202 cluster bacterium Casp-Chloro-G4]
MAGNFNSKYEASGQIEISASNPCKEALSASWFAIPVEIYEAPEISRELLTLLPDLAIPKDLFIEEDGDDNIYEFGQVLDTKDDWVLVAVFDSIFPVPQGWLIWGTGKEDAILLFSRGGIVINEFMFEPKPEIVITIGIWAGDYQTAEEGVFELQELANGQPEFSTIGYEVIDDKAAYIFLQVQLENGNIRYILYYISQFPDGSFRAIKALADGEDWDSYYPVTRAIIEGWASAAEGKYLGASLPESLRP